MSNKPTFIHSDIFKTLPLYESLISVKSKRGFLIAAHNFLKNSYGKNLIFPAFNYEFSKTKIFDIENNLIQVGALSEYLHSVDSYKRTPVPFFSVLYNLDQLHDLSPLCTYVEPFGKNSVFEWMYNKNCDIVFFGTNLKSFTFIHYVEGLIPNNPIYRYDKLFEGSIIINGVAHKVSCKMHVRPMGLSLNYDTEKIETDLRSKGILFYDDQLGLTSRTSAQPLADYLSDCIKKDPFYPLTEESKAEILKHTSGGTQRIQKKDFE